MLSRSDKIVADLLEAGPDDLDHREFVRGMPDAFQGAAGFIRHEVMKRFGKPTTEDERHRMYAGILRDAFNLYTKPHGEKYTELFSLGVEAVAYEVRQDTLGEIAADFAVEVYGDLLVGARVDTARMGTYPGGPATVVELGPDDEAPDIAFNVYSEAHAEQERRDGITELAGIMGIFDYETITLL